MREPHDTVRSYYSDAVTRHGPTPRGVDWPSAASQYLRFVQLLKVCDFSRPFSLNDFGCGYGALLAYFAFRPPDAAITYHGIDISPAMIAAAREAWAPNQLADFAVGSACSHEADYSLASGVFNVRLGWAIGEWEAYVESILRNLRASSRLGFSVNFMLPLDAASDEQALYRTRPERWMEFFADGLGCPAELVSNYGLREFTLLARIPD